MSPLRQLCADCGGYNASRTIVRAASQATKAADYLLGFSPEMAQGESTEFDGVDQEAA
jgi:antirestriction protein ArdC